MLPNKIRKRKAEIAPHPHLRWTAWPTVRKAIPESENGVAVARQAVMTMECK